MGYEMRFYVVNKHDFKGYKDNEGNEYKYGNIIAMYDYSKDYDLLADEMIEFLLEKNPSIVAGMKDSMYQIKNAFPQYRETVGYVGKLTELTYPPEITAYSASAEELEEIVKLVMQEDNLGKHYGYEMLYKQFYNRKMDNFGRNFISRDESNNEIICHAATYAELPELAVISGVITSLPYRGKGYSKGTLAALCDELISEGKGVFSYFHIVPAVKMHLGIGFEIIGEWVKFKI